MHSACNKVMAFVLAAGICLWPGGPVFANGPGGYAETATPIRHLVVIFNENISFDHYFGTYPNATNPSGEPQFYPRPGTPTVNGLSGALLTDNPNLLNTGNGTGGTNPFRLDRSQAATADQNHSYGPEQSAADMGLIDLYPKFVGTAGPPPNAPPMADTKGLTMGYFDGNTVTALWNYAQHFALSDNSYGSTFGPSTVGLMNLVAGQTNGVGTIINGTGSETADGYGGLTVIDDPDPIGDMCSSPTRNQVQMTSQNIGDLLRAAGITWGSFMGGFNLSIVNSNGTTGCSRSSTGIPGTTADYIPHHAMFQYWASTTNSTHARPKDVWEIGNDGPANHEYDLLDFYAALSAGNLPAVSFIKQIALQDGHAGYSDPVDEQTGIVNVVNAVMQSPYWHDTAIVILYDDSDGWYDHQLGPIVNQSSSPADTLTGKNACGNGLGTALPGANATTTPHAQGRCGYGIRQPLMVISPWARENFVDNTVTDQSSIIHFIEDNWLGGQRLSGGSFDSIANSIVQMFDFNRQWDDNSSRRLILDSTTGEPVQNQPPWPW